MKELLSLNKYFWKYRLSLFMGILFVVLSNLFNIFPAQITRNCIDLVIENLTINRLLSGSQSANDFIGKLQRLLLLFGIAIFCIALIKGLFMFLMRQTLIVMSRKIEFDLKNDIYKHYQKLDLEFYKTHETGDLMNRITEDVSRVRMYVGPSIMYIANMIVTVITVIVAMLQVNLELTLWTLLPLPLLSLSIFKINSIIHRKSDQIQKQLSQLTSTAQESYAGIRVLKSFSRQDWANEKFEDECNEYQKRNLSLAQVQAFFMPLMGFFIGLSTIVVVYVGGMKVISSDITGGNIAEFIIYLSILTFPFSSIGWVATMLQRAAVSQKRINEFLNTQPSTRLEGEPIQNLKGAIRFEDVSFTYPHSGIQALDHFNMEINAGEKVMILGKTGSGKTTLLQMLLKFYTPDQGHIYIDEISTEKLNIFDVRKKIGYVAQDVFLFSDTIENNIAFGIPDKSDVEKYARMAYVHDEILKLENGYETIVGERGVTLSGGQKQRIAIARTLAIEPQILILDDSLSAVDANTEIAIQKALNTYMEGRTSILVSHRIFNHIEVDKIVYMQNGTIIEYGNHVELMAKQGEYYKLYHLQQGSGL